MAQHYKDQEEFMRARDEQEREHAKGKQMLRQVEEAKNGVADAVIKIAEAQETMIDLQNKELDAAMRGDEDSLESIRRRRIAQMKEAQHKKKQWLKQGHGKYISIDDPSDFFREAKQANKGEKLVVHFYRSSSRASNTLTEIMDKHLDRLCKRHLECKFLKINAEKKGFQTMCERFRVQMLPSLVCIVDNKPAHVIAGFDELGGSKDFSTSRLEMVLTQWGVLDEK